MCLQVVTAGKASHRAGSNVKMKICASKKTTPGHVRARVGRRFVFRFLVLSPSPLSRD